jgi:phosphoribosylformimino-5-aminoimidazole carboxamide ribotide isomerase
LIEIYPAIDMRGGQVVRLRQGDPNAQTTFASDPAQAARRWLAEGARWLHVVNLDGAFSSEPAQANLAALERILALPGAQVQFGGGVRSLDGIAQALHKGAARVVLGTVAIRSPEIVREAIARFGAERIVVGLDARDGSVTTDGWQQTSTLGVLEAAERMHALGVRRIVYTDIARDGMLLGVNVEATRALARASRLHVIASGGLASLDDIRGLVAAEADGVEGVVIGQALYTGHVALLEALALTAG